MKHAVGLTAFSLLVLVGCSSAPESAPSAAAPPAAVAQVPDHTSLFPDEGKVSASVIPDHILGMKALPGGSLAEYNLKGQKYQMFVVDAESAQKAAFEMLDMKAELKKDPEYISYMGGYFGMYGDQPLYCFSKLHYLAGVVGLPKDKADKIAIAFAGQLH
jgi:hypothetical protein